MSVLLETSQGDVVIDLLVDYAPKLCENFLKLCKIKYYNYSPIHSIQKSFSFQTGDPLGPLSKESDGGSSIWGVLEHDPARRTFPALFHPKLKHLERGTVGMATVAHPTNPDVRLAGSQFIVSLADDTDFLDGKSAIFGRVVEGFDTLEKINDAIVDANGYPLVDIRINHTVVLDDPYPDPPGLVEPPESPQPSRAQLATARLGEDEQRLIDTHELDDDPNNADKAAQREKERREKTARAQALTLEVMGDLPSADIAPPENVLFVCKLNPVTQDADLELIFSRFGTILSCEVIRDQKTGDSLQYAFIEFDNKEACEAAYFKMQDVLIDDRRIHVDFSQSVSKLTGAWWGEKRSAGRSQGKGGWGGVDELEKWRKYRNDEDDDGRMGDAYDMVHDGEARESNAVPRRPPVDGSRDDHDRRGNRGRSRDHGRYSNRDRGSDERDRRDRGRDTRDKGRENHHQRDKVRDGDRRDHRDRRDRSRERHDDRRKNDDHRSSRGTRDRDRGGRSQSPRRRSYKDDRDRHRR